MATLTQKLQIGAATAAAAAAAFAPGVAQAAPAAPQAPALTSFAQALGNTSDLTCEEGNTLVCPVGLEVGANASTLTSIFQNQLWWFGTPNPTPPAGLFTPTGELFTFTPLALIPGFLQPVWGFFTENINFEACVVGATLLIGPYGTTTGKLTQGC